MSTSATKVLLELLVNLYPFFSQILPTTENQYEYDYQALQPLAVTAIPEIKIPLTSILLPQLPKDEVPTQKWLALVVSSISLLVEKKKIKNTVSETILTATKSTLETIQEQIKAAKGDEELARAVLNLKLALTKPEDEQQESSLQDQNFDRFRFHEKLNKFDQNFQRFLNTQTPEELSNIFRPVRLDESGSIVTLLREITRHLGEALTKQDTDSLENSKTKDNRPTLADYENLITQLSIEPPQTLKNFQQDEVFAYLQVAGPNPMMLNQIGKLDSRLPIANEQYQTIVPQDSLEAALHEGRLYLADYSKLGILINGNFGGLNKYVYAPVALFSVPPDRQKNRNLLPVAINFEPSFENPNSIFTPQDGENWMTAKTLLQMADSNYHELISHLAQTHLFIEPFVLATNRCFTNPNHPVRQLLKPHLEGTALINYGAHKYLLGLGGSIDSLLSGSIGSNSQLAIKEAIVHLANFNNLAFPQMLKKRGVSYSHHLPIYPYREDGLKIWGAIHQWVNDYLHLFYPSDESVVADRSLQKWANELFAKGHCHIGEEKNGQIKSLDYLVEAISIIIFSASAQHAAVNFPQSGLMTYAPAFPLGCYSPGSMNSKQQQNFMNLLPPLERADLQIRILYLLGSVYYTKLGDYSESFLASEGVKEALSNFQSRLAEIEESILQEDSQRLVSYQFLMPSKIPQSINI